MMVAGSAKHGHDSSLPLWALGQPAPLHLTQRLSPAVRRPRCRVRMDPVRPRVLPEPPVNTRPASFSSKANSRAVVWLGSSAEILRNFPFTLCSLIQV